MGLNNAFGSIVPSQRQQALESNYLNFTDGSGNDFAQQYLPEVYEAEVERYGNRTLSGFLRMVGAEMPMSSDQVVWSEQNRLHIAYTGVTCATATTLTFPVSATASISGSYVSNVISIGQTLVVMNPTTGKELKVYVKDSTTTATSSSSGTATISCKPYTQLDLTTGAGNTVNFAGATNLKIFVYGSEYKKGTRDTDIKSVTPSFTQYSNSPIIIKEKYVVNGSDTAQIGWVEVATEDGTNGFLWYLKAESETRLRFEDYLEMSMVEGELVSGNSTLASVDGLKGTQGLFAAIQDRGNVETGFTAANGLTEFDAILKNLDTQGAIEENMLFLQRQTSLDFDDMLAAISSGQTGGVAYGLFENSEDMALNLGFSGFRRGSYDFYKTDWKYLNDASTRGAITGVNSIEGVLVPAGTSTVYDQILGTNIRRPFLHVRYRASQTDDRRMKSWLTGSVGGASTSTLDAMEVNFLSERCLITQAANNFVLFTWSCCF
jgi:LysM repeat protein